jgi:hypothetical protein
MATTTKQITANQHNAQKSSGPKSTDGKVVSSRNATRHGLLSSRLFLPDEKPQEFQQLFDELFSTFNPLGVMEMLLVEKMAVAIWKQRRLVAAETGAIALRRQPEKVLAKVNSIMNYSTYYGNALTDEDTEAFDKDHETWCKSVEAEREALAGEESITLESVQRLAPFTWEQLQQETVDSELASVEAYLEKTDTSLVAWLLELEEYTINELEKAQQRPLKIELYNYAFAEQGILADQYRDSLERYQASLDNQLYKAMKELRQLQDWRLSTIKTMPVTNVPMVQAAG